ncbi:MAG: hypothetical protein ACI915_002431 [Gammaproteobacteria bacterium]|jgi:hypothetical protein
MNKAVIIAATEAWSDAMKIKLDYRSMIVAIGALLIIGLSPVAISATTIFAANVTELDGKAFAVAKGGVMRRLKVNDRLYEQERVITSRKASVSLTFTDGTAIALGAKTIITVDSYSYRKPSAPEPADAEEPAEAKKEAFSMSILQGAVRAVTGLLAKRRPLSVRFRMKVATIGIRGTHFAAEVDGDSATIILLAQQDPSASNAIEVSNAYGKVDIDQSGWGTEIPDATSPPSPPRKMNTTHNMGNILRSINTTRRVRIPRSPMR